MQVREISVHSILVSDRKREEFGDIESFAERIRLAGGLMNPILVEEINPAIYVDDLMQSLATIESSQLENVDFTTTPAQAIPLQFRLVAGERRLRAITHLGWPTIPAHVKSDLSDLEYKFLELSENSDRKQFEWWEEVAATRDIHNILEDMYKENPDHEMVKDIADKLKSSILRTRETVTSPDGKVSAVIKTRHKKWGLRQTAEKIGKSIGTLSSDIELAIAIEHFPELKEAKSKQGAKMMLDRMKEEMLTKEIGRRFLEEQQDLLSNALNAVTDDVGEETFEEEETSPRSESEQGDATTTASTDPTDDLQYLLHPNKNPPPFHKPYPHTYLFNCNALNLLRSLADHTIDILLTDPPYGLEKNSIGPDARKFVYEDTKDYLNEIIPPLLLELYLKMKLDSYMLFFCSREAEEIIRESVSALNDHFRSPEVNKAQLCFEVRPNNLMWYKYRGSYTDVRYNLPHAYETILMLYRGRKRLTRPHTDVFSHKRLQKTLHVGQKPIPLLTEILDVFSLPGEVILDTFAGVLSTACAAMPMGRIILASELSAETYGKGMAEQVMPRIAKMREAEEKGVALSELEGAVAAVMENENEDESENENEIESENEDGE